MRNALYSEKEQVVNILSESFHDNRSVNYIVKQDKKKERRLRRLMEYSFELCYHYGKVFLSDDKKVCALIVLPEKKKTTLRTVLWDIKLIFGCIGIANLKKAMARESKIRALQPKGLMFYLWFVGVDPTYQGKGIGTDLMIDIISESEAQNRAICLETSTLRNLSWYQRLGFEIYHELDIGYNLFF